MRAESTKKKEIPPETNTFPETVKRLKDNFRQSVKLNFLKLNILFPKPNTKKSLRVPKIIVLNQKQKKVSRYQ